MGSPLTICHSGWRLIHFPPKLGHFLDYFIIIKVEVLGVIPCLKKFGRAVI